MSMGVFSAAIAAIAISTRRRWCLVHPNYLDFTEDSQWLQAWWNLRQMKRVRDSFLKVRQTNSETIHQLQLVSPGCCAFGFEFCPGMTHGSHLRLRRRFRHAFLPQPTLLCSGAKSVAVSVDSYGRNRSQLLCDWSQKVSCPRITDSHASSPQSLLATFASLWTRRKLHWVRSTWDCSWVISATRSARLFPPQWYSHQHSRANV